MDHFDGEAAHFKSLAVLQQPVEIAAVGFHILRSEDRPENVLHVADMLADGDPGPGPSLDQRRAGQVVGMDMGFKDPFKRHAYGLGSGQQLADRIVVDRSRGDVEIEHRIDRDPATTPVPDQIADRIGRLVEEGADLRFDTHSTLPCLRGPPSL